VPEDEPTTSISAGSAEVLNDEVMPFEARPPEKEPGVRSPKSGVEGRPRVRGPKSGVEGVGPKDQRSFKQPNLFNGGDE
jgi:hypothetical protein